MLSTSSPQWGVLHCNLYILVLFLEGSGIDHVHHYSGHILPTLCITTLSVWIFGSGGITSVWPYRALHFWCTFSLLGGHCWWLTLLPPVCSTRYPSMQTFPGAYLETLWYTSMKYHYSRYKYRPVQVMHQVHRFWVCRHRMSPWADGLWVWRRVSSRNIYISPLLRWFPGDQEPVSKFKEWIDWDWNVRP